jgi:hypothetical protein
VQFAFGISREAEGLEQTGAVTTDIFSHQFADTYHFVAMVRVGNHITVAMKDIEHWEAVRRKSANAA